MIDSGYSNLLFPLKNCSDIDVLMDLFPPNHCEYSWKISKSEKGLVLVISKILGQLGCHLNTESCGYLTDISSLRFHLYRNDFEYLQTKDGQIIGKFIDEDFMVKRRHHSLIGQEISYIGSDG